MKPEQLKKLHFDAFAFLTTVGLLRAKIDEGGSSKAAQISMMTALAFNLILSLELTLKLIHIVTTGEPPRTLTLAVGCTDHSLGQCKSGCSKSTKDPPGENL